MRRDRDSFKRSMSLPMTRLIMSIMIMMLSMALFLSGCSAGEKDGKESGSNTGAVSSEDDKTEDSVMSWPYTFTDDLGREITLEKRPERVAVLFSSYAEIWRDCGGSFAVTVGDSVKRGFAPEGTVLANETTGFKLDMEVIVNEEPDLVIVSADITAQKEAAEALNGMGIPCAAFHVENFDEYLKTLRVFADLNENATAYEKFGLEPQAEIREILAGVPEDHEEVTYLFIRAGNAFDSTKARTAENHFACVMLDELGAVNIADSAELLTEELSLEAILERDPDIIIVVPQGDEAASKSYIEELFSSPGWSEVGAITEERWYFVSKELYNYKPNSRWPEAYRTLRTLLYGD